MISSGNQVPLGDLSFTTRIDEPTMRLLVNSPFLSREVELCVFAHAGQSLLPQSLVHLDENCYLVNFALCAGLAIIIRVELNKDCFQWSLDACGSESTIDICFPFLKELSFREDERWINFFSLTNRQSQPMLRYQDADAPLLLTNGAQSLVILQSGELVENSAAPDSVLHPPGKTIQLTTEIRPIYQGCVLLTDGGWRGAFSGLREHLRARVGLSEYNREDLQWYAEQFIQHFTFLYGREILDLDRGTFNVDRFLDEGERDFGGYDGFLIWSVYPRIGVDERTQWELYDDLPGGRETLRDMSRRARERGVRFFVPYKPWDRSAEHHGEPWQPHEEQLAQLITDTEADGVFLDTMDLITPEFRQAIDQRKSGVVFCSEGRTRGKALDIITGCWDQSPNRDPSRGNWCASDEQMPVIDLWRFVLPEHRLFVINRHSTAKDRLTITQRAFFNGMGWVIWQNIFGLALPYSPAEAALLKKCRTIFRENVSAVNSPNPTPLIDTGIEGLYANEFPVEQKRMWTFYNETTSSIHAPIREIQPRTGYHLVDAWNEREAIRNKDGALLLRVEPQQLGCVVEYPRLIEVSELGVRINLTQDGLTWRVEQGDTQVTQPAHADQWVAIPRGLAGTRVCLLKDREVLDQVFFDGAI